MPIYEYECKACGAVTEILERGGAHREDPKCESCGSEKVEKMLSSFAAVTTGGAGANATSCCGLSSPCSDPKRCCGL